jgi:release factor glutamine methyltransferase
VKLKSWLSDAKSKISSLDAELIAVSVLGFKDRTDLVLHSEDEFDFASADELVFKRAEGMPLAYLLGSKEFFGRNFYVDENVLIPRPETEQIVLSVFNLVKKNGMQKVSVLDVGTGSGCIPITIKKELDEISVTADVSAVDLSGSALEVAKKNAKALGADVAFWQSDLLAEVSDLPDILTANLPYVDRKWDWTSAELKYEPEMALYAEDDGLSLIKKLVDEMVEKRVKGGIKYAIFEADPSQHDKIVEYTIKRNFELLSKDGFSLTFRY